MVCNACGIRWKRQQFKRTCTSLKADEEDRNSCRIQSLPENIKKEPCEKKIENTPLVVSKQTPKQMILTTIFVIGFDGKARVVAKRWLPAEDCRRVKCKRMYKKINQNN